MAFTPSEWRRGAMWAWLVFVILLALLVLVPGLLSLVTIGPSYTGLDRSTLPQIGYALLSLIYYAVLVVLIGGTLSAVVTVVTAPVAALLGRAMVRVRSRWLHACTQVALGAVVGAIAGEAIALTPLHMSGDLWILPTIAAGLTGVSAGSGWWITAHKALREDARLASAHSDPS